MRGALCPAAHVERQAVGLRRFRTIPEAIALNLAQVRRFALSLPEASEEPHHDLSSFRVRGKIFATVPPDGRHLHIFVDEQQREPVVARLPAAFEKLWWGSKVVGVRVVLAKATSTMVNELLYSAWCRKAPKRLVASFTPSHKSPK
jgi:hypothetical protein